MFRFVALTLTLCLATHAASASPVLLGATVIEFTAQGSSNTRVGTWNANPLVLSAAVPVDYFQVIVLAISGATPETGLNALNFDSTDQSQTAQLNFCYSLNCPTGTLVGSIAYIYADTTFPGDPREVLDRLVLGAPVQVTTGQVLMTWGTPFPTSQVSSGEIWVRAYGVVPIPPAVYLFGSALGVTGVMRRKVSENSNV